ncbi:hypothetical protein HMPREF1432_00039 [Helicobacter pylori GAMchJs114i]|nr:hypothetical protein HMPREF1392_01213 [Helicobacter pylori GAM101Biv]EMJ42135.1 hypothetical protein HMPREF1432_00039 [Helicobacter pylori GAMchJs114i]
MHVYPLIKFCQYYSLFQTRAIIKRFCIIIDGFLWIKVFGLSLADMILERFKDFMRE